MARSSAFLIAALLGVAFSVAWPPAYSQTLAQGHSVAGPDYGEDGNYRTPAADGRPGVYYFDLGAYAFKKGDYQHAIDMYKIAASWAYKPAEYNLGLMYFNGHGVSVNRPRGAAWMILAAERGEALYVKARDLMVTDLTKAEFQRTDEIWNQLKPAYGDAVALARAKAQWIRAGRNQTGSHVGHSMDNLRVGALSGSPTRSATKGDAGITDATGGLLLSGGSQDGSVAYQQFDESNNPYSPVFQKNKNWSGVGAVKVGQLQEIKSTSGKQSRSKKDGSAPSPSTQPPSSS